MVTIRICYHIASTIDCLYSIFVWRTARRCSYVLDIPRVAFTRSARLEQKGCSVLLCLLSSLIALRETRSFPTAITIISTNATRERVEATSTHQDSCVALFSVILRLAFTSPAFSTFFIDLNIICSRVQLAELKVEAICKSSDRIIRYTAVASFN